MSSGQYVKCVVTFGTGGCLNDNLRCHQWRQSSNHDDFQLPVLLLRLLLIQTLIEGHRHTGGQWELWAGVVVLGDGDVTSGSHVISICVHKYGCDEGRHYSCALVLLWKIDYVLGVCRVGLSWKEVTTMKYSIHHKVFLTFWVTFQLWL